MLHPVYLLQTDAEAGIGVQTTEHRDWWRPRVVVPRGLCVFENVPCSGLAWYERRAFARLQARRRAPFATTGCNAVIRGGSLMLWFWDQAEVLTALRAAGIDAQRVGMLAETLLLTAPRGSGERRVACRAGTDTQLLRDGAIIGSRWEDGPATPGAVPLRAGPWGWELIGRRGLGTAAAHTLRPATLQRALWLGSLALATASACFASYWGGTVWSSKAQLQRLEAKAADTTLRRGDVAALQRRVAQDKDWVSRYERLALGVQWPQLLEALSPSLEAHGVVMKEMEVRQDEVRLAVVTAGSAIDLPSLLSALSRIPGVDDVQLRLNVDIRQATFSLRAPGFMKAAGTPSLVARQ